MFKLKKRLKKFIVLLTIFVVLLSNVVYSGTEAGGGGGEAESADKVMEDFQKALDDKTDWKGTIPKEYKDPNGKFTIPANTPVDVVAGTIRTAEQVNVGSNQFSSVESFNVDSNGNILAQYLVMNAIRDSTFTMINPINKCKAVFNIPSGGKITISNRDKTKFETISSSGIKQGLACQCSAGISFTAKENNAKLIVASSEKEDVHRYDMENLCMDYSNNKDYKETFCSKAENSFSKLSCASGIDSLGLGKEAYYKYISEKDNKKNFEITAPIESQGISAILLKTGAKYQESESSSVIDLTKQDFILKNIVEFKNYLDYTIYKGLNKDNTAEFKIENGIVKNE